MLWVMVTILAIRIGCNLGRSVCAVMCEAGSAAVSVTRGSGMQCGH